MKINKEIVISVAVGIVMAVVILLPYYLIIQTQNAVGQQSVSISKHEGVLQEIVTFLNGKQEVAPVSTTTVK